MKTPILAAIAVAAAAAHAGEGSTPAAEGSIPPAAEDSVQTLAYACPDGGTLQVVFINTAAGNSYAVLSWQGELMAMQVGISASGARYVPIGGGEDHVLWNKGNEVSLYGPGNEVIQQGCTEE